MSEKFAHIVITKGDELVLNIWSDEEGFKGLLDDDYKCEITYRDEPTFGDEQFSHQEILKNKTLF